MLGLIDVATAGRCLPLMAQEMQSRLDRDEAVKDEGGDEASELSHRGH